MSWFASEKLDEKGELQWIRDVWNDSIDMEKWMMLSMFQKTGQTFDDLEFNSLMAERNEWPL